MIRFIHSDTRVFVLIHDVGAIPRSTLLKQLERAVEEVGFVRPDRNRINVMSAEAAGKDRLANPIPMLLNGGAAFLDWKVLPDLEGPMIEIQLGGITSMPGGMFSDGYYSPEIRDRLVAGLERLCGLPGFCIGFEVHLGKEFAGEGIYREYFDECVLDGRLSLVRLIHHGYLPSYSFFVGQPYLNTYGKDLFLKCPAWRISQPSDDAVCIFLHNLFPTGMLAIRHEQIHVREGFAYLESVLRDE